jgi:hypothetical protein
MKTTNHFAVLIVAIALTLVAYGITYVCYYYQLPMSVCVIINLVVIIGLAKALVKTKLFTTGG